MPAGGARAGAGRPKGSISKVSAELREHLLAGGVSPLEYMLQVMRDATADSERRDKMAQAAAPFVHPKLASTEVSGPDGDPLGVTFEVVYVKPQENT